LPLSGDGHSFDAPTHSFSGTGLTTPSPASNVRSLSNFNNVFKIAEDALKSSSTKA
jgi:hypothetical protein